MADKTGIEWMDATWNPIKSIASILNKNGSSHEAEKAPEHLFTEPLRWKKIRFVMVCDKLDLFYEAVPDEWIDEVFAIMALCPQHTFQILTKRPDRMRDYMNLLMDKKRNICSTAIKIRGTAISGFAVAQAFQDGKFPLENVWLGTSIEDQRRANDRIATLLNTHAAVRFLSMEPLVGGVDLNALENTAIKDPDKVNKVHETCLYAIADRPAILPAHDQNKIDWVIVGGESGAGARPMHPDWVRYLRDQCVTAAVPFFFKQWGQWAPLLPDHEGRRDWAIVDHGGGVDIPDDRWPDETLGEVPMVSVGKKKAGNALDGETWQQMPERVAA